MCIGAGLLIGSASLVPGIQGMKRTLAILVALLVAARAHAMAGDGIAARDADDVAALAAVDSDGDGIVDDADNCILVANPDQRDTDGDGFGSLCDPDLTNDCIVNNADFEEMQSFLFSADANADLTGDGRVDPADLGVMKSLFFQPPGPSGVAQTCGI